MNKEAKMKIILEKLHEEYPNAKVSLNYSNPFELLVGTILSAQSTDKKVNEALPGLFGKYPTPEKMCTATPDEIVPYIKSIGLYNRKSKSLVNMAKILVEKHDGKVPANMKDLTKLPGVGRKTANVVLGNALGVKDSGITVDTHVKRLSQRMGFTLEKYAKKIEKDLMEIVPKDEWVQLTHLFIYHGRKICDRKPACDKCTINEYCSSAFEFDHFNKDN